MKNKKGFTLIELLAVIVILAIIALIAVPVIMNILDKANKSAFKDTAYGILSAGELYFAEQQLELNGMLEDKGFTLPSAELDIKGQVPEGTKLYINTKGQTALAMSNGRYCVTKGYEDTDITVSEDVANCTLPSGEVGTIEKTLSQLATTETGVSIPECITNKTICTGENLVAIKVNDTDVVNFYVISDDNATVTLIMSENLGNTVAWYLYDMDNSQGPTTAINELDDLTDEEWNNIPKRDYLYSGIAEDGKTRVYEDITRNMRARMATYDEIKTIIVANNNQMPDWLYGNLYTSTNTSLPSGYWTSTARASRSDTARYVNGSGLLSTFNVSNVDYLGLRPVIELSK